MAFKSPLYFLLYVMILSLAIFCSAEDDDDKTYSSSKATYYKKREGEGACGLKEWEKKVYDGKVGAVSYRLYKDGKSCGTCYEVKCKEKKWCSEKGTKMAVTDCGKGREGTDFTMSYEAYGDMAKDEESKKRLFKKGEVEVKYKRVKCDYYKDGQKFIVKYDKKNSKWPDYHKITAMYNDDKDYIAKVKIIAEDEKEKEKENEKEEEKEKEKEKENEKEKEKDKKKEKEKEKEKENEKEKEKDKKKEKENEKEKEKEKDKKKEKEKEKDKEKEKENEKEKEKEKEKKWVFKEMRRAYGAVWDIATYKPKSFVEIETEKGKKYYERVKYMDKDEKDEKDDKGEKDDKDDKNKKDGAADDDRDHGKSSAKAATEKLIN
ncbi:OLC1v1031605C1 [Oldenlandia corymbosa var. corymbosa]|uniref:OLC1v1031605C1 n=1 Tax=Oldenlandia corymbosa var. corymbosa TaxID=529605 RepID=A0AAV1CJQ0_OLDCO|nr:OLC1v1031605C1 [Oldenlandia corymbosa var. corymbosa]